MKMQRGRSRFFDWALTLALFAALTAIILRLDGIETQQSTGRPVVIDGDSLVLAGVRIRLKGIDAPEIGQICNGKIGAFECGRQARAFLRMLVGASQISCEGWQYDKYQRLLADCQAGLKSLNREMALSGWAVAYGGYAAEEAAARKAQAGLWAGTFDRPQDWRKMKGAAAEAEHDFWQAAWHGALRLAGIE
jgi:endonuclease YncB( thermonuclease family)